MIEYLLQIGCDTLFIDYKGRTPLHYACILNCDKKIVQLFLDFNREFDKFRAHSKEAMDDLKERPIKNFDYTPTIFELIDTYQSQSSNYQKNQ